MTGGGRRAGAAARTGEIGDGRAFELPVGQRVRVRIAALERD
jgi:nitrogen regulatory protein PII